MKNVLLTAVASLALAAVAAPASADNLANWTLHRTKTTTINETDNITKFITINVTDTLPLNSEGSALVLINSSIDHDIVGTAHVVDPGIDSGVPSENLEETATNETAAFPDFNGDPQNYDIRRHALISGSINNNVGVGQVNQDVGNNSNQGNVIAAGLVFGGNDLVKAEAYVEQLNFDNSSRHVENFDGLPGNPALNQVLPIITATLTGSLMNDTGVFMVNQNAGNMNAQHNALALAVGDNAFTALADAGLNQVNSGNTAYDVNTVKADVIDGSIIGDTGVVAFNQSVGSNNNQATVINIAAITSAVDFH